MSVNLARVGGLEPPETTVLTTVDPTTVFSGTERYLRTAETISLANVDASNACIVKLEWVDETPTGHVFWNKEVPAKDTITIDNLPILLDGKGKVRSIRATAASVDDIHVTVISSAQTKQSPLP
jgi:hypothetical protein